jgi:hypothetical protein
MTTWETYVYEDNIKMDLKETEFEDMDWIYLARVKVKWRAGLNTVINHWVL